MDEKAGSLVDLPVPDEALANSQGVAIRKAATRSSMLPGMWRSRV